MLPVLPVNWTQECMQLDTPTHESRSFTVLALIITTGCLFVLVFGIAYWRKRARAGRQAHYRVQTNDMDGYPFDSSKQLEPDADAFSLGDDHDEDDLGGQVDV